MHVECRFAQAALADLSTSDPKLRVKCNFPDCQAIFGRPKVSLGMHHGEVLGNPRQIDGKALCDGLVIKINHLHSIGSIFPRQETTVELERLREIAKELGIQT